LIDPTLDAMTLQQRFEALAKDKFLGVPVEGFEAGGKQLRYLLRAGLNPSSKLVDLGCGVLRAGYWIIRFLETQGAIAESSLTRSGCGSGSREFSIPGQSP